MPSEMGIRGEPIPQCLRIHSARLLVPAGGRRMRKKNLVIAVSALALAAVVFFISRDESEPDGLDDLVKKQQRVAAEAAKNLRSALAGRRRSFSRTAL